MMKTVGMAGLALLFIGAAAGCGSGPGSADGTGRITNAELAAQVRAKLNSDPELARLSFDTDAANKQVSLSGTLGSEELRARAVSMVGAVFPELSVKDSITVAAPQGVAAASPSPKTPARKASRSPGRKPGGRQRR